MKPLSFMNLSGGPVQEMANYFKIDPETEMVVSTTILIWSRDRFESASREVQGGITEVKDIIRRLGTEKFLRIKVGVGAKPKGWDLADHVLSRFADSDRRLVDEAIENAGDAVEKILSQGPDAAMNEYNRKKA